MIVKNGLQKKKSTNVSAWMLFAAVFIVLIFFAWYIFIYVNSNEKSLVQNSFRVLNQIGENFRDREKSFRSLINSNIKQINKLPRQDVTWNLVDSVLKKSSGLQIDNDDYDSDAYYFEDIEGLLEFKYDATNYLFKIDKDVFFSPLERKDIFDGLMIIDQHDTNVEYSSLKSFFTVSAIDSLIKSSSGVSSGTIANISLAGVDYKMFVITVELYNEYIYHVGGLINSQKYSKNTRAINPYISIMLLIIFLTFLVSIPIIKLKLISESSQLKISDLIFSATSIVFGTLFLLIIIFSVLNHGQRKRKAQENIVELSNKVNLSFTKEIDKINSTLQEMMASSYVDGAKLKLDDSFNYEEAEYKFYKLIFGLNNTGYQDTIISSRNNKDTKDNYSFRNYFKNAGEWNLDGEKLMLDFIVSNTSGEKLGVVSKRKDDNVFVITSRLTSVINTIMPEGYGFAIIDNNGGVKFHSDDQRMLSENFWEEVNYSTDLKNAIDGNASISFTNNYLGNNHLFYASPISTLPLYLVTFYNQSYSNPVKLQITGLTFSFSLLLIIMFAVVLVGSRLVIFKSEKSGSHFDLIEWIRPDAKRIYRFKRIYITNCCAVFILFLSGFTASPAEQIFITFTTVLIQMLTAYIYINFKNWNSFKKEYLFGLFFPAIFIIAVMFYQAFQFLNSPVTLILYNAILVALNIIILFFFGRTTTKLKDAVHFYVYLSSWITLLIIVPTFLFFILFHNHELRSSVIKEMFEYAKKEQARNYEIDKFYMNDVKQAYQELKPLQKINGVYFLHNIKRIYPSPLDAKQQANEWKELGKLLYVFELNFTSENNLHPLTEQYEILFNQDKSNNSFSINYFSKQKHYSENESSTDSYSYLGVIPSFGFSKMASLLMFLVIIGSIFFILFKLIVFITNRMFGIAVELSKNNNEFNLVLIEQIHSKNHLVIQYSNTIEFLKNKDALSKMIKNENENIIIETLCLDLESTEKDYERISNCFGKAPSVNTQMVVIMNCTYDVMLEDITDLISLSQEASHNYFVLKEKLESIGQKFTHVFPPLKDYKAEENDLQMNDVVRKELQISDYLFNRLEKPINEFLTSNSANTKKLEPITIIDKIQDYAKSYYESIWEGCSKKEKLLLLDIAEDHVLNDKNINVLLVLLKKGLLINDGYIKIMNTSFRNFLIQKPKGEYEQILDESEVGKWKVYRAPLVLLVFALAFFIAFQENLLNNLTSVITTLVAGLGIITKLTGLVSVGNLFPSKAKDGNK